MLTSVDLDCKRSEPSPRIQRGNGSYNQHAINMPTATKHIPQLSEKDKSRFWAKVNKDGPLAAHMISPCHDWTACLNRRGYGYFGIGGKPFMAHRLSFALAGGVFTEDKPHALHVCDRPKCCNPDHIIAGNQAENVSDMIKKGRDRKANGERKGNAKLTAGDVLEIRERLKSGIVSQRSLAREFGVCHTVVSHIFRRKDWAHI